MGVYVFQALRRSVWYWTRPKTEGVHGIPLTSAGKVVLVKLSYAPHWQLPGGGLKKGEDPAEAIIRELREEIGLTDYAEVEEICRFEHEPDYRRGRATLFLIRGIKYQPCWSLEVREAAEFDLTALPYDTSPLTRALLDHAGKELQ